VLIYFDSDKFVTSTLMSVVHSLVIYPHRIRRS